MDLRLKDTEFKEINKSLDFLMFRVKSIEDQEIGSILFKDKYDILYIVEPSDIDGHLEVIRWISTMDEHQNIRKKPIHVTKDMIFKTKEQSNKEIDHKLLEKKRKEILKFAKRVQQKTINEKIKNCIKASEYYFNETDKLSAKICKRHKIDPKELDSFLANITDDDFAVNVWANPCYDIKVETEKIYDVEIEVSEDEFILYTKVCGINIEFWGEDSIVYKLDNEYLLDIAFLHGQGFDLDTHLKNIKKTK
jgi:hypothetical protein